jgi:hypothetical protein
MKSEWNNYEPFVTSGGQRPRRGCTRMCFEFLQLADYSFLLVRVDICVEWCTRSTKHEAGRVKTVIMYSYDLARIKCTVVQRIAIVGDNIY